MELKDKGVFLTGGARGLGRGMAEALLDKGARVSTRNVGCLVLSLLSLSRSLSLERASALASTSPLLLLLWSVEHAFGDILFIQLSLSKRLLQSK